MVLLQAEKANFIFSIFQIEKNNLSNQIYHLLLAQRMIKSSVLGRRCYVEMV